MSPSQAEPPFPAPPPAGILDRALALVEFLRAHCPWDAAQTPRSLRRYLLEESHEVIEAIERGDEAHLQDELGDLLLNLAFQLVLAEERDAFTRTDVVEGLEEKMRRRHPHLYGGEPESWASLKARERAERRGGADGEELDEADGVLGDLAPSADALRHAGRIQERVAGIGFDWADARGAWEKVREEVEEVGAELDGEPSAELEEEIGDLLFSVVNLARLAGVDPPLALNRANAKFGRRFAALERIARQRGVDVESAGLEVLDGLWEEAKREER